MSKALALRNHLGTGLYRAIIATSDGKLLARLAEAERLREIAEEERASLRGQSRQQKTVRIPKIGANGIAGESEDRVYRLLSDIGLECQRMPYNWPFDILVGGILRVEVKTSNPRKDGAFEFNIHRSGRLRERCDLYVLELRGQNLFRVMDAPIGKLTVRLAMRESSRFLTPVTLARRISKKVLAV